MKPALVKLTDTNDGKLILLYHQTVKKVTEDYKLGFQFFNFSNDDVHSMKHIRHFNIQAICRINRMLSCITPHIGKCDC